MDPKIAIAWIDLTFKVRSLFTRKEKTILNKLNGFVEFGTLTAVMGPSGAGLTSLLMCLNGMNNSKLSKESVIRLSNNQKIRSTFVGHNEKEFLIMGLTAKQNLIYASKLKNSNCGQSIDHEWNVYQIMADLMITDTMNTKAENCSGGEQKRLAIALELTAFNKPNIIFCDEPTTGLDSNLAEMVIQCLRRLSKMQNIAIISTIHQPNTDVIQRFDSLYVLAKGGVCVYSGTPQHLPNYLNESNLKCDENQVPIEMLITIGSKEYGNGTAEELRSKTSSELMAKIDRRRDETKPKFIKHRKKAFKLKDVYFLLNRGTAQFFAYKYKYSLFALFTLVFSVLVVSFSFGTDLGRFEDCFSMSQLKPVSCMELVVADHIIEQNISLLIFGIFMIQIIQCMITIADKIVKLRAFKIEHRNKWYSTGVYYLTEAVTDFIPNTLNAGLATLPLFFITHQRNEAKRYWAFFYIVQLSVHTLNALGHTISIIFYKSKELCFILALVYAIASPIFTNFYVSTIDLSEFVKQLSNISLLKFTTEMALITIYGFERCPTDQVSKHLFMFNLIDDDIFWENSWHIWAQFATYNIAGFIWILFISNLDKFELLLKCFNNRCNDNSKNNEIELRYTSGTTFERFCYINEIDVNLAEEVKASTSSAKRRQSLTKLIKTWIQIELENDLENSEPYKYLSIGWTDLTLRAKKTFYSTEKVILKRIKGFLRFGTLTALMGPSGAGKSTLLRCFYGLNRNLVTKESKILLSKSRPISICFIAQNQREHIVKGLTVYQAIIYASRLKNSGKAVDHNMNVNELFNDLDLNHIKYNNIEKCSSGEQKRIVLAMELTAVVKPNLICVDEPTSGIDNNTALHMIKIFKCLTKKYNLSIITSIHQPNTQIVSVFDMLYVLAKGGVCVYSGPPQNLRNHLRDCEINCTENQIPIEILLKVGLNGCEDQTVIALVEKTNDSIRGDIETASHELKVSPNGIPFRSKIFSFAELWYLLMRTIISFIHKKWFQFTVISTVYLLIALGTSYYFDFNLNGPTSCIPKVSNSCALTPQFIRDQQLIHYNIGYHNFSITLLFGCSICLSALAFSSDLKIFNKEYRNRWYSIESFFLVKTFVDMIPILIIIIGFVAIIDTNYESEETLFTLVLVYTLLVITSQSLGHITGILFSSSPVVASMLIAVPFFIYGGVVSTRDLSQTAKQLMTLVPFNLVTKHLRVFFYGRGRCPEGQLSSVLYKHQDHDDDLDKTTILLVSNVCLYYILSYICLKIKTNWDSIWLKIKKII